MSRTLRGPIRSTALRVGQAFESFVGVRVADPFGLSRIGAVHNRRVQERNDRAFERAVERLIGSSQITMRFLNPC